MKFLSVVLLIVSIASLGFGAYKLLVYEYEDNYYVTLGKNAYVTDDGQNRIINANYATAFFVLSGVLGMFSFFSLHN